MVSTVLKTRDGALDACWWRYSASQQSVLISYVCFINLFWINKMFNSAGISISYWNQSTLRNHPPVDAG